MTSRHSPADRTLSLWPGVLLRLLLTAVFAVAGASKIPDPAASVRAVRAYRLLPEGAVHGVAYGLPVLELALAALLLLGLVTRLAAALSALLLVVFLAGIASVAARGLSIDCGCFGGGGAVATGHTRYTAELLRDGALLAAALALVRWPRSRLSVDRWLSNGTAPEADEPSSSTAASDPPELGEAAPARHDPAGSGAPSTTGSPTAPSTGDSAGPARGDPMSQAPPNRRSTAREAARRQRAAELARARRRRTAVVSAAVVAVLAVLVGIGVAVQSHRSSTAAAGSAVPAHLTGGGVVTGSATAPVTVTVYEDFQCPVCRQFEQTTGPTLDQLRQAGTVKVISKPVAILDRASSTRYSTRALNAAACVIDSSPQAYPAFKDALFAEQPEEGSAGLTDATLTATATRAGATDVRSCIDQQQFRGWTQRTTDQASRDGLTGTPYVLVNGTPLTNTTPDGLQAAVTAAQH